MPDRKPMEFGHTVSTGTIGGFAVHVDNWGVGPFVIVAGGKSWRFEDSDRFGPHFIGKRGDMLSQASPAERSPFWRAHRIWRRQGRQVGEDGLTCLWDEPKPTLIRRLSRRHFVIVENGEEDGAEIEVDAQP